MPAGVAVPPTRKACAFAAFRKAKKSSRNGSRSRNTRRFPACLNGGIIGTLARLPLQLDGRLSSYETGGRRSSALHGDGGLRDQTAPARRRPTVRFFLSRRVVDSTDDRATVEGTLSAVAEKCARPVAAPSSRSRKAIPRFIAGKRM